MPVTGADPGRRQPGPAVLDPSRRLLLWAVRNDPIARGLLLDTLAASTALASQMLLVAV